MRLGLGSSVRFLGEVPPARVTGLVSQAQVFVILHQCRYAGLSFTAIEAMQFGTPVVINAPEDLYGPGMLKDGQNIVLVDANDVKEIADKIILLLENRRLREHIGQNGRQFVDAYLRWDINAQKTEDLYVEVLDRGRVSQH
jgi:glycosyltransferase involved in cell wall biosynthesis